MLFFIVYGKSSPVKITGGLGATNSRYSEAAVVIWVDQTSNKNLLNYITGEGTQGRYNLERRYPHLVLAELGV